MLFHIHTHIYTSLYPTNLFAIRRKGNSYVVQISRAILQLLWSCERFGRGRIQKWKMKWAIDQGQSLHEFPTEHFTVLEPQNPPIAELYSVKKFRLKDLKLRIDRPGCLRAAHGLFFHRKGYISWALVWTWGSSDQNKFGMQFAFLPDGTNPTIDAFYVVRKRQSTNFEALILLNIRSVLSYHIKSSLVLLLLLLHILI